MSVVEATRNDAQLVAEAAGLLRSFNEAGILAAADVHVALRLGRLGGDDDDAVLLAAALAVRAPRQGSVCVDLATISVTAATENEVPVDLQDMPWPSPYEWLGRVAASPLVAVGEDRGDDRPLRLLGTMLYLDRYWRDERLVAAELAARSADPAGGIDETVLGDGLDRLFHGEEPDLQRLAAAACVLRRLGVVGGGPGTGKTTTVARILALLHEQAAAAGAPAPLIALAAPTGKAATRLEEAVRTEASTLDVDEPTRAWLRQLRASTLHRLLGARPGASRFRYHRRNRLPHDVVIVDETSMVSLSMTARLLEAVRSDARLVLVGDPKQLASVEAGAVLGDLVGPAADTLLMRAPARAALARVARQAVPASDPPADTTIGDGIVVLRRIHRFHGAIADLAEAIRTGDAEQALGVLRAEHEDVRWIDADVKDAGTTDAIEPIRAAAVDAGRRMVAAARAGDAAAAVAGLGAFRLLCAHRRGPYGVATWNAIVESWLADELERFAEDDWYVGRPLLVTRNDQALRLSNGDTGVIVARDGGRKSAVFAREAELIEISPTRLEAVETVHALTIHKSQGSQADAVAVVLPNPASRILTRELLYTAVTRARALILLCGTEETVRAALDRRASQASGLERRLWG